MHVKIRAVVVWRGRGLVAKKTASLTSTATSLYATPATNRHPKATPSPEKRRKKRKKQGKEKREMERDYSGFVSDERRGADTRARNARVRGEVFRRRRTRVARKSWLG